LFRSFNCCVTTNGSVVGFLSIKLICSFILCLLNLEGFALKWYYSNVLYRTVVLYSVTEY
jgi:hypothetical protein